MLTTSNSDETSHKINLVQHDKTGLLAATCQNLPGLLVTGKTEEEIITKLPAIVKMLLAAQGEEVAYVEVVRDENSPEGYFPPTFLARSVLDGQAA